MRGAFRLALGFAVIALAIAAAVFFADRPGTVHLLWLGRAIDTSVAVLIFGLAVLAVLLWIVIGGVFWLVRVPGRAFQRRRDARRLAGYRVLTDGLVALAAGDAREAERLKHRAELMFEQSDHAVPPLARTYSARCSSSASYRPPLDVG